MTNRKTKSVRKIGPASTSAILPPPARRATAACHNSHASHSSHPYFPSPESRITHHASRTRNGKIARLPFTARDMVNRMLRNNVAHSRIVDALDELAFKVTERNISNWKTRGGYRDWCIAQDRALETRLLQDNLLAHLRTSDASQLAEVGLQLVATQLSQFFLNPETREQLATEPEKFARSIGILCRLARQIHILQKYRDQSAKELGEDHNPELHKRETDEALESIRDIYSAEKPSESPEDPYVPHHNFLPKNGYPAKPTDDTPEDNSHIDHNIKLFEASLAAVRAQAQSHTPQTFPGSTALASSSDSPAKPEHSDQSTPSADHREPQPETSNSPVSGSP